VGAGAGAGVGVGAGAGVGAAAAAPLLVSQRLTWPRTGSVPKNAFEHWALPATVFCNHASPEPYRTTRTSVTLKASFSLATNVQPSPLAGVAAAGAVAVANVEASAALASPLPLPPQPANRTATEQKSKCTGFNCFFSLRCFDQRRRASHLQSVGKKLPARRELSSSSWLIARALGGRLTTDIDMLGGFADGTCPQLFQIG
jgi:hypothetical protein